MTTPHIQSNRKLPSPAPVTTNTDKQSAIDDEGGRETEESHRMRTGWVQGEGGGGLGASGVSPWTGRRTSSTSEGRRNDATELKQGAMLQDVRLEGQLHRFAIECVMCEGGNLANTMLLF